jgi:hypothetical protein
MKKNIFILLILLLGLIGIKALFSAGFYTNHDGTHQIIRLMHFHKGLVDQQWPVRWAGTALNGYGYPLFVYTYRLPFWLGEFWYLFSRSLVDSIKFVFIVTYLASGISMFVLAKKVWRSNLTALLSSILYLWAPYRFINIYVRAALGEAVIFVFIPLLFLGLHQLAYGKNKIKWILLTAFSAAGAILSHAIVFGMWVLVLIPWFLLHLSLSKHKKQYTKTCILSGGLTLLLTAYYWLPAFLERKYTYFSGSIGHYYKAHFLTLKQLLYSRWGYGFSMPGAVDDDMSFQIGFAQWLVIFVSGICIVYFWRKKISTIKKRWVGILAYCAAVFLLTIYLMTAYSTWFYKLITGFFTFDIPWRFLGVSVFMASLAIGGVVRLITNSWLRLFIVAIVLFLAFYGNRNHLRVNKYTFIPDSEYWQSQATSNEYNDYAPKGFKIIDSAWPDFDESDSQLLSLNGKADNKLLERRSNFFHFTSSVSSNKVEVLTRVAYYPGWQLLVDGKKQPINYQDGRIVVQLDKGNHEVVLQFKETRLRAISNIISLGALIILLGVFLKYGKKK